MPRIAHPRVFLLSLALLTALSAGCGRDAEDAAPDAAPPPEDGLAPLPDAFEGAWAGVLPCLDCDGIEVDLELQRESGAVGRYRLIESYLGSVDDAGFEVAGEWREEPCRAGDTPGDCIVLVESGQRWFRHMDGTLQAVDVEGRALDPDGARLLRR